MYLLLLHQLRVYGINPSHINCFWNDLFGVVEEHLPVWRSAPSEWLLSSYKRFQNTKCYEHWWCCFFQQEKRLHILHWSMVVIRILLERHSIQVFGVRGSVCFWFLQSDFVDRIHLYKCHHLILSLHLIYFIKAKYTIGHHINTKIDWKDLAFAVIWWQLGKLQKRLYIIRYCFITNTFIKYS